MYIFITVTYLQYTDSFTYTLNTAMSDDGFRLPTADSKCALQTQLQIWCSIEANHPCIENYQQYFHNLFCRLITSNPKMSKFEREKIWLRFHNYITSGEYLKFWESLYSQTCVDASAILSFYITYTMFTQYWKTDYPLKTKN